MNLDLRIALPPRRQSLLLPCHSGGEAYALTGFRRLAARFYPGLANQAGFVASFTGVYLLTYPWIGLSTARLVRRLAYLRHA